MQQFNQQFKALVLLAAISLSSIGASAGQRTFYWTGKGAGQNEYSCYQSAKDDGYRNAVNSCSAEHGMDWNVCANAYISNEQWIVPFSSYTGTCALRVYITVTY